jgi:chemotaxis protein CheZ
MNRSRELEILKKELLGLFRYMQRVRQEIAAIHHPSDSEHGFNKMSDQLDAIVEATEEATNTIMEAVENNEEILRTLRDEVGDPALQAKVDQIRDNANRIFEACSFQDITGQRITKVVRSLSYVEQRVNAIIDIWGKQDIDAIKSLPDHEKTDDEKLLSGPQRKEEAISQDEIDKLFS